ncbi:DUF305 domain-containing protein [Saccharothrix australiensis]|uniref:Uncharacterized protein (DUF305 family) n=1 Tax=Saccharothrix australiensis TaxID=2072 RepID=A0A495W473_9PSEU|nr:DUF305 domain-containing protein [Saccharothrix australiensis]RKT56511.1 uncharacterized protein (DUF305 family) [Saccharothrix australiensis]
MRRLTTALVGLLLVAGCGIGSGSEVPAPTGPVSTVVETNEFNPVDVMFLHMAVPHHKSGLEIVKLAKDRPVRADIKNLASAIEVTQLSEVDSMLKWLHDWNQPESADDDPQLHAGHGGDHSTSPEAIAALARAESGDFEKEFLNVLIAHQHNAVEIAKLEREGGVNPQAKALAERIFHSRTGQISQMLGYLE